MNEKSIEPNLFDFAQSELSQDAILCWLFSWSDPKFRSVNSELNEAGQKLLKLIFQKHKLKLPSKVSITVDWQVEHADLIVEVGDNYVVLVEDKTKTNHHGDQLLRYLRSTRKRYPDRKVLPAFMKTGDQCDFVDIESCGYCVCKRSDILSCIWPNKDLKIKSDILRDWAEYLSSKEESIKSFWQKPVANWTSDQWTGLYQDLRHHFPDLGWKYVHNPAGGFMGAWWGWQAVGNEQLYLQINERDLCIRIEAGEVENRTATRERWHQKFVQSGSKNATIQPQRPTRFGNGKTMTVAVVPREQWLLVDSKGLLKLPDTLQRLRNATSLLRQASRMRK